MLNAVGWSELLNGAVMKHQASIFWIAQIIHICEYIHVVCTNDYVHIVSDPAHRPNSGLYFNEKNIEHEWND